MKIKINDIVRWTLALILLILMWSGAMWSLYLIITLLAIKTELE